MSQSISIHGHFDGKVIVPDEPVNLPVNQPLIIDIQQRQSEAETLPTKNPADFTDREREEAFQKLIEAMADNPVVPLESLRRVNLYEDGRY